MPKYDRQLIVIFHCGTSHDVKVVKEQAHSLNKKGQASEVNGGKSHLVTAPASFTSEWHKRQVLKAELHKLTPASRLYIYGHCDWAVQKVGTYTGKEMADLLNYCGLRTVKLISIVACKAARDYDPNENLKCFASHFLTQLAEHNCQTEVFARSDATGVWPKEDNDTTMRGRKWTRPDEMDHDLTHMVNQKADTKWRFTYANSAVKREVVTYRNGNGNDI